MALPKIIDLEFPTVDETTEELKYKNSFAYDYKKKKFLRSGGIIKNNNTNSLTDWIERNTRTVYNVFPALSKYESGFGTEIERYTCTAYDEDTLFTLITKELRNALTVHPTIETVIVDKIERKTAFIEIDYTVYCIDSKSISGKLRV